MVRGGRTKNVLAKMPKMREILLLHAQNAKDLQYFLLKSKILEDSAGIFGNKPYGVGNFAT